MSMDPARRPLSLTIPAAALPLRRPGLPSRKP